MGQAVLCAIDESTSSAVTEVAADLAGRLDLPLVLARVGPEINTPWTGPNERERAKRAEQSHGQRILRRIGGTHLARAPVTELRVRLGRPVTELLLLAEEEDAEVIVVGSRGRGTVAAAVLGSHSRALVREAPCPVVVVPPSALSTDGHAALSGEGSSSVICGVSAVDDARRSVGFAADVAQRLGERLVVVLEFAASGFPELASLLPGNAEVVEFEGTLAPGVESVAQAENARLAIVEGASQGPLRSLIKGSPEEELLRRSPVPLLLLPPHAQLAPGSNHYQLRGAA